MHKLKITSPGSPKGTRTFLSKEIICNHMCFDCPKGLYWDMLIQNVASLSQTREYRRAAYAVQAPLHLGHCLYNDCNGKRLFPKVRGEQLLSKAIPLPRQLEYKISLLVFLSQVGVLKSLRVLPRRGFVAPLLFQGMAVGIAPRTFWQCTA